MVYNPKIHKRKSIRLKGYDYSSSGAYFITMCMQDREKILSNISESIINLTLVGKMIEKWWLELKNKYHNIDLDEYIIMPDHFHGIIWINNYESEIDIPRILKWFKAMTTNEYIRNVKENNWKTFNKRLWQRNYYEKIIRNEKALNNIREYIKNNPLNLKKSKKTNRRNFGKIVYRVDIAQPKQYFN